MGATSLYLNPVPARSFFLRMGLVIFFIVTFTAFSNAATYTWNNALGGPWTTITNWTPNSPVGGPPAGSDIVINISTGDITDLPTISLNSLTISGNCLISAAVTGNTLTITSSLSIAAGYTLTLGLPNERIVFTLAPAATATVNGNFAFDAGMIERDFTVWGTLIVEPTGRVYDPNLSTGSVFILEPGATLEIGNTGGIWTTASIIPNTTVAIDFDGWYTYSSGANYVYVGNANQVTGVGLNQNTPANVTINNPGNTVTLSANTNMSGTLTVTAGSTFALSTYTLGVTTAPSSVVLYDGANTGSSITGTGALYLGGNVTVNSSGTGTSGATISAPITLTGTRKFTVADDGTPATDLTVNGIISGAFGITKEGPGIMILTANNTYNGITTITAGDLRLNPGIAVITPVSQFLLNGGTLSTTNIIAGRTIKSSNTMNLALSSTINLGANAHKLAFADSHSVSWTVGQMITINGWTGGYNGTSGTAGQIFFGASNTTLTAAQLCQIQFFNGTTNFSAMLLNTGELVPGSGSTITVTGTSPLCVGATAPYTVTGGNGGTWSSSNIAVATVNAATGLVTAVGAGTCNIIYTIIGGCSGNNSGQQSLIVNALPTPVISGPATVCSNSTGNGYSTPNIGGHTYVWAISGGTITGGAGTNSVTVTWNAAGSGWLTVTETITATLCAVTTAQYNVTINALPTPVISGPATVCASSTGNGYSTPNIGGHTYVWAISGGTITGGAGTNSVTVTWNAAGSGWLTVTETITATLCAVTTAQYNVTHQCIADSSN
jgi:autotransporter-associated beta strand protein